MKFTLMVLLQTVGERATGRKVLIWNGKLCNFFWYFAQKRPKIIIICGLPGYFIVVRHRSCLHG